MPTNSVTTISLPLGRAVVDLALHWLVEAPPGEWVDGALIFRGQVTGLAETACAPIPAEDALVRDYGAGGIPLLRVTSPLESADAYQRPRWQARGWLVEWLTLDPRVAAVRVDERTIELRLYPPHRGASAGLPFAFALLAAPVEEFTKTWRAFAAAQGLPGAHRPEERAKLLRIATQPTLFAMQPTHHRNADLLLDWCAQAGFGSILLNCWVWAKSDATYDVNTDNWPGGWPMLRAFVDRAHERGLAIGLHTMTTSVANTDPLVTPVPDPRLLSVWSTRLRAGVDAADTTLPLEDSPAGLSLRDDYMSYGRTVQIGDELITYTGIDVAANALTGCIRGAYGTRMAAHSRGAAVRYLFRLYDEFALDTESDLADEVAANLARAFAETGAEMIYFDDSEAVPGAYAAHISCYHEKLWRAIGIPHLHVQASSTGASGTYMLARVGQQDTTNYKRALLDGKIVPALDTYLQADLVPDLGWFGINFGDLDRDATTDDDLDCLLARMHGCGGGATVFATPALTGTALFQQAARRMALWRRWRASVSRAESCPTSVPRAQSLARERPASTSHGWLDNIFLFQDGAMTIDAIASSQRKSDPAILGRCSRDARAPDDIDAELVLSALMTPGREFRPVDTGNTVILRESLPFRRRLTADATGSIELTVDHPGPAQPLALSLTMRPPVDPPDSADNIPLYRPGMSLAPSAGAGVADPALLRWRVTDFAEDFARWRLAFPTPVDLTAHRVLAVTARLTGACATAVVRLVTGLRDWVMGEEYVLPLQSGTEMTIIDPQVELERHFHGRWPDPWFSFSMGVKHDRIEGLEIALVGLTGEGTLALHSVHALRERRPSGQWPLTAEQDGRQYPLCPTLPWDGTFTLTPDATALRAEVREPSGSLHWQWRFACDEMPALHPGENRLRLYGFPPGARVDLRIDRMIG